MSDIEDDLGDFLERTATLARERGHFERPSSELLQMAEELCGKYYETMRAMNKIAQGLAYGPHELLASLLEHGEEVDPATDAAQLEYFATRAALSEDDLKAHNEAMTAEYGPGYLVGA